jgi:hypothetical protein
LCKPRRDSGDQVNRSAGYPPSITLSPIPRRGWSGFSSTGSSERQHPRTEDDLTPAPTLTLRDTFTETHRHDLTAFQASPKGEGQLDPTPSQTGIFRG